MNKIFDYYYYNDADGQYQLSFGLMSTVEGLELLNLQTKIIMNALLADDSSFSTHLFLKDIPTMDTVGQLSSYILNKNISPSHIELQLIGLGDFSSHDDYECHFTFEKHRNAQDLLRKVTPNDSQLYETLIANMSNYVTYTGNEKIQIYQDFDQYLVSTESLTTSDS